MAGQHSEVAVPPGQLIATNSAKALSNYVFPVELGINKAQRQIRLVRNRS